MLDAIPGSPMVDGPFTGIAVSFDIGSEGMRVVPVPAAIWLFASGIIGLIGIARRKQ